MEDEEKHVPSVAHEPVGEVDEVEHCEHKVDKYPCVFVL
jgi:hypothetical protein